jgi:hypothetical protein
MEMNPNYEMVSRAVLQLCPVMARTSTDSTETRIAKSVFRWSLAVAGAAVVVVVVNEPDRPAWGTDEVAMRGDGQGPVPGRDEHNARPPQRSNRQSVRRG